jgi:hypothetical protein
VVRQDWRPGVKGERTVEEEEEEEGVGSRVRQQQTPAASECG